jgi:hypothetical protein
MYYLPIAICDCAHGQAATIVNPHFKANSGDSPAAPIGWAVTSAQTGSSLLFGEEFDYKGQGSFDCITQTITLIPGCQEYSLTYKNILSLTMSSLEHQLKTGFQ